MKRLAILAFVLGAFVAPAQAQTQKPLEFNGMIFDSPSAASSYAAPNYVAPRATTTKRHATHVRKHHYSHPAT
jgi:hypothetical protein